MNTIYEMTLPYTLMKHKENTQTHPHAQMKFKQNKKTKKTHFTMTLIKWTIIIIKYIWNLKNKRNSTQTNQHLNLVYISI